MAAKRVFTTLFALLLAITVLNDFGPKAVVAADKPTARASHILVPTETECDEIVKELEAADDLEAAFARLAKERSKCPSSRQGGDLGSFGRGQMVPEFDMVAFEKPVGEVHKVKTQFGWHLVLITDRSGMGDELSNLDDDEILRRSGSCSASFFILLITASFTGAVFRFILQSGFCRCRDSSQKIVSLLQEQKDKHLPRAQEQLLLCGLSSGWRVIVDGKHTPILFFDQLSVSV
ncbi:hypothetical protein PC121_g14417 [Phytophthora cactorum]|nr:hypothetical protein PC121_g14417 [Phytophthora cactorum]